MTDLVLAGEYSAQIGDVIETFPMGEWPGGVCMVVGIAPKLPDALK